MAGMLADVGEQNIGVGGQIQAMYNDLLPTYVPAETSLLFDSITAMAPDLFGDRPSDLLANSIMNNVFAQGAQDGVPFEQAIRDDFGTLVQQMAFVDTSLVTTEEQMHDMIFENPIVVTPWDNGLEKNINQYDPLWVANVNEKHRAPGYHTVATPPIINHIQLLLAKTERDAAIFGVTANREYISRRRIETMLESMPPSSIGLGGTQLASSEQADKRMRGAAGGIHSSNRQRAPAASVRGRVDAANLDALRVYGSSTPEGLHLKWNYLGPVTQIQAFGDLSVGASASYQSSVCARRSDATERKINHSYYNRGKVQNMFAPLLKRGDNLYFTIAVYEHNQVIRTEAAQSMLTGKRGFGASEEVLHSSAYIGAQRSPTADTYVQIRGWASGDGRQWLGDTSPIDALKPDVADRWYVDRTRRAAVEFRQFVWDDATDRMVERDLVAEEGLQEAIVNVPDIVIEEYLAPGIIIPVGTVKQRLNTPTTPEAIANAHYSTDSLMLLPHVEIYQNC